LNCSDEFFGLLRSWADDAAKRGRRSVWFNLKLVIGYSSEAHLFIQNMNQSPFNVGELVTLRDFVLPEAAGMAGAMQVKLSQAELQALFDLVGGQPHLWDKALRWIRERMQRRAVAGQDSEEAGRLLEELEHVACSEAGPFWDHLWHMLGLLAKNAALRTAMRRILGIEAGPLASDQFYNLRSGGFLIGEFGPKIHLRCRLYKDFLALHLKDQVLEQSA
jgi:hypothetical protein